MIYLFQVYIPWFRPRLSQRILTAFWFSCSLLLECLFQNETLITFLLCCSPSMNPHSLQKKCVSQMSDSVQAPFPLHVPCCPILSLGSQSPSCKLLLAFTKTGEQSCVPSTRLSFLGAWARKDKRTINIQ